MALEPVIAVQSKLGELEALLHTHDGVQPMVELLDSLDDDRGLLLPKLVKTAVELAHLGRSLWVDAHRLTAASKLRSTPGGVFERLDQIAEDEFGLLAPPVPVFIPVLAETSSTEALTKVSRLREQDDRPVVVRVRGLALPTAELAARITRVAELTRANDLHVVIDAGYVKAVNPLLLRNVVDTVRAVAERTSVTLLAGSV
ncbi:MAG: hypothetical protein ABWY11_12815, partial [Umezawaea sp.]